MKLVKTTVQIVLGTALIAAFGCSNSGDVNGLSSQAGRQSRVLASVQTNNCTAELLANFEKFETQEGMDASRLPEGLYLYSSAEVLLESRVKPDVRFLAREIPTSKNIKSQVLCSSRDSENVSLDASLKALTKIKIKDGKSAVTVRQYQGYMNDRGHGMVALNPILQAVPVRTLQDFVQQTKARFFKIDERTYAVLAERESEDAHLQVLIKYEFISGN